MAYNSNYRLDVIGADRNEATTELEDIVDYDPLETTCPWYEHDEHMQRLAKRFPSAVFVLHREGEESPDIERTYYRHGQEPVKVQPQLVWPEPPEWART